MLYQGANFSATEQMNWLGVGITRKAYALLSRTSKAQPIGGELKARGNWSRRGGEPLMRLTSLRYPGGGQGRTDELRIRVGRIA